eukprot:gene7588-9035_t
MAGASNDAAYLRLGGTAAATVVGVSSIRDLGKAVELSGNLLTIGWNNCASLREGDGSGSGSLTGENCKALRPKELNDSNDLELKRSRLEGVNGEAYKGIPSCH